MKKLGKGLLVLAAIIMSFISVQNVNAETVEGLVASTSLDPNIVTVWDDPDFVDVYGVQFDYLLNHCDIVLVRGDEVSIEAEEFYCKLIDITILKATSINGCELREPRQKGRR